MRASRSDYNTIIEDNDDDEIDEKKPTLDPIQFISFIQQTHTYVLYSIMNHSIHLNFRIVYNA